MRVVVKIVVCLISATLFATIALLALRSATKLTSLAASRSLSPVETPSSSYHQLLYDQQLLVVYKLYMEEHLHMPYNGYEDVDAEVRDHAMEGYRAYYPPLVDMPVSGRRSYSPSLLGWVLTQTQLRFADVGGMSVPRATRQCFRDVMAAPDRLDLVARPTSRHNSHTFFELVGPGVDPNTVAVIPSHRGVALTIRVKRDAQDKPLWDQCGDHFQARLISAKRFDPRAAANMSLPVVAEQAFVIDNFDYTYTVLFDMPHGVPADVELAVEVVHGYHRFNYLRPFAGLVLAKLEKFTNFLNDPIEGSPFRFRFTEEDTPSAKDELPLYAGGFLEGAYVNGSFVPKHYRLENATTAKFNQCMRERNYCLVLWGCSVTHDVYSLLRQYIPETRLLYELLGMLSWRGEWEGKGWKLEVLENLQWAYAHGLPTLRPGLPSWNCTAMPDAQLVFIINSGVHEVAWGENYPYSILGIEWLIRNFRELFPEAIIIWNRSLATNNRRFAQPHDPRENDADLAHYRNAYSETRLDLIDLFARRTMHANNLTVIDSHGPTYDALEFLLEGDMRHYRHGGELLKPIVNMIYTRICTGPRVPPAGKVFLPELPPLKSDAQRVLEERGLTEPPGRNERAVAPDG